MMFTSLMPVGGDGREFGSVHYRGLIPMNIHEFPAMNFARAKYSSRALLANL
jgi:hypothetical protein